MSYEVYKIMHLFFVIFFFAMVVRIFSTKQMAKIDKIFLHSSGFFILVGGMGLLARLGVSHTGGWPLWVKLKLGLWVLLFALFGIFSKRLVAKGLPYWHLILMVLGSAAIYSAVYKP